MKCEFDMRFPFLFWFIALVLVCELIPVSAREPSTRPLTAEEMNAIREPIELGDRIYRALYRYLDKEHLRIPLTGPDVVGSYPTVNVLHAAGFITDADIRLSERYHVSIAAVIFNSKDPAVMIQTVIGEVIIDARGQMSVVTRD